MEEEKEIEKEKEVNSIIQKEKAKKIRNRKN